jgi:hypothetical protein
VRTEDGDDLAVYRQGPYGDLVGRRVDDLPVATPVDGPGHVDRAAALRDVDVRAASVPAYQSGEVVLRAADPTFAVALNGRIAGISRGYLPNFLPADALKPGYNDVPHPRRWWTMVPPQFLRNGENRLDLYVVQGDPGNVRLRAVHFRPPAP